jgi:hypothetical protein
VNFGLLERETLRAALHNLYPVNSSLLVVQSTQTSHLSHNRVLA